MSTTLTPVRHQRVELEATTVAAAQEPKARSQWIWIAGGLLFAFLVPFLFADLLELNRDVYYGLYAAAVTTFLAAWIRSTGLFARSLLSRRWAAGLSLGALFGAGLVLVVLRTEDGTARPDGLELAAAIVWRGIVYGLTDGLLLAVFPILAVFAAFTGSALRQRLLGKIAIGALALGASLGITATYHLGYRDFRSDKLGKPVAGMPLTAAPTLLTLSPLGAPIAHAAMHTAVVLHSYETDTFLPPHPAAAPTTESAPSPPVAATRPVSVYFFRGETLAPVEHVVPATPAVGAAALRELFEGPTAAERETGIASAVPVGSRLLGLTIEESVATVNLSDQFAAGGGSFSVGGRLAQLVFSLTQFESVSQVAFELNGEPVSVFSAEGLVIDRPLSRATYEQARPDSLEASFLPAVLIERPAQGAAFASPLRVTGTASGPFVLTIVDWDGRVIEKQAVTLPTGARTAFDVTLRFEPGLYPRGALIVSQDRETIAEIPLGK